MELGLTSNGRGSVGRLWGAGLSSRLRGSLRGYDSDSGPAAWTAGSGTDRLTGMCRRDGKRLDESLELAARARHMAAVSRAVCQRSAALIAESHRVLEGRQRSPRHSDGVRDGAERPPRPEA
jgi:hypothetical protein